MFAYMRFARFAFAALTMLAVLLPVNPRLHTAPKIRNTKRSPITSVVSRLVKPSKSGRGAIKSEKAISLLTIRKRMTSPTNLMVLSQTIKRNQAKTRKSRHQMRHH